MIITNVSFGLLSLFINVIMIFSGAGITAGQGTTAECVHQTPCVNRTVPHGGQL